MGTYVFDQAWDQERERLGALEDGADGATIRYLAALGVAPGWRCLEVGGGAGSIARWLAERVGAAGHVVATDLDPRFLAAERRPNLEVRRHDILADPLEVAAFDLVHVRAVLEHLPARAAALTRLVAATRPGGWVLVEDTFFGGPMAAAIGACTSPGGVGTPDARTYHAVATLFEARGARADYGPRLPEALQAAGLVDVGAELHARFVRGGAARDFRRLTLEQLRGPLLQRGLLTEAELAQALALTWREDASYLPIAWVSAWGRRPPAAAAAPGG